MFEIIVEAAATSGTGGHFPGSDSAVAEGAAALSHLIQAQQAQVDRPPAAQALAPQVSGHRLVSAANTCSPPSSSKQQPRGSPSKQLPQHHHHPAQAMSSEEALAAADGSALGEPTPATRGPPLHARQQAPLQQRERREH